jgi:hypothetical protein
VYVPPADVRGDLLAASHAPASWCEFKGAARYLDAVVDGHRVHAVAWTYRHPTPASEALRDHVAFHPGRVDVASMGDERVQAQASDFYGGWITATSSDRSKDHRKRLVGETPTRTECRNEKSLPQEAL